jgi:hypothetical protein
MSTDSKYKLVRDDGKVMYSSNIKWLDWNESGTIKKLNSNPAINRSLIMYEEDKLTKYYNWLTTIITDIKVKRKDFIEFTTEKNIYKLYIKQ